MADPEFDPATSLAYDGDVTTRVGGDLTLAATLTGSDGPIGGGQTVVLNHIRHTDRSRFDVAGESAATRDAYGRTKIGGRCLMARRMVEAGARFIMVDYGYDGLYGNLWDLIGPAAGEPASD